MSQISFLKIRMQRVISVLVMLVLVFNMGEVVFSVIKQGSPLVLMGLKSESDYLVNNLGWYAKVMDSIRQLSDENSVLLLFEQRSYYCRPRCFPDETNDRWKRDWQKFKDPGLLLSQWKKEGFTHILYNKYEAEIMRDEGDNPYTQADWDGLDSLITLLPKWNSFGDSYLLFKIP